MEMAAFPWLESETAQTEMVALRNVFLHVTKACNLRCAYCYFSASRPLPGEMTTEEFARLWPEMVALRVRKRWSSLAASRCCARTFWNCSAGCARLIRSITSCAV